MKAIRTSKAARILPMLALSLGVADARAESHANPGSLCAPSISDDSADQRYNLHWDTVGVRTRSTEALITKVVCPIVRPYSSVSTGTFFVEGTNTAGGITRGLIVSNEPDGGFRNSAFWLTSSPVYDIVVPLTPVDFSFVTMTVDLPAFGRGTFNGVIATN